MRRLIFNNDGGDATKEQGFDLSELEDFLDVRTTPLAGSHVDTMIALKNHRGGASSLCEPS